MTEQLRKNLRVGGDLPLDFTKVTHGKLHLEALAALDAERARAENTEKFLSKTQDRVELLESLNLRALARIQDLEAVAEAAQEYFTAFEARARRPFPGTALAVSEAHDNLCAALAVLEEPQ